MATKTADSKKADTKAPAAKPTRSKKATGRKKKPSFKSRAVVRLVEPGSQVECQVCGERVKFQARMRNQQAICNIYVKNVWQRVEHFHADCYEEAGQPYGKPVD